MKKGKIEPIAPFTTNPAGGQIARAVGPIRETIDLRTQTAGERRYLAIITVEDGKLGQPVQLEQPAATESAAQQDANRRCPLHRSSE